MRAALTTEFERRLERVASTAASQIDPASIGEASGRADEGAGYLGIQVQLVTLRSVTGVEDASVIDRNRIVVVDARAPDALEGSPSPIDTVARAALTRALGGSFAVSEPYRRRGLVLRAGLAPVRDSSGVAGLVAIEAAAAYLPVISGLARTLAAIALVSVAAIAVLAGFMVRAAVSAGRLERRLSRSENLAAMGRLTATLAHEIKNPLAIIRGSAERLKRLEPEAQRMADFVIEESDRLSRTVARYLQFARGGPESGDSGDAMAALHATLDLLEGELASRRVALERPESAPASVPVTLDSESLKQVYLNLMLNAMEAMPEGGRIRIAVDERPHRIEVSIADEGPGIPPEVIARLGSPFVSTKAQGSGLGLFLTHRLVKAGGGDLVIERGAERGTVCRVRLPRSKGTA